MLKKQLSHISRQINAHLYFALHVHNYIFEVTDISVKQKLCTLKMWNSDPTILYTTVTILFCSTSFKFEANLCSPAKICGIFTCSIKSLVSCSWNVNDAREKLSYHNRRWSPFFWIEICVFNRFILWYLQFDFDFFGFSVRV